MSVTVSIPTPLRKVTRNQSVVEATGEDILSVIDSIDAQYPGFRERLCDEKGTIRRFVNVYLNDEDIRYLDGPQSKVRDGDKITIIPAIAGG